MRPHLTALALSLLLTMSCGSRDGDPGPGVPDDPKVPQTTATYVGREVCAACHAKETADWKDSHHDLSMDVATDKTVLGDFDGAEITHYGVTSRFYRKDGKFLVNTEGEDGKLTDFEISYVFGVTPLQQYLVGFPGGRYQCLPLCWDSRLESEGGQRWFHIQPDERMGPGDNLFWTGINQNWNYMCAECHSTNLRKNYRRRENRYETTWSEIDVSCEACHGPGSAHVEWVEMHYPVAEGAGPDPAAAKGLVPLKGQAKVEACSRCHARCNRIANEYEHARPFSETHRLQLLDEGIYHADGQILEEAYVYGSFVQSRMFREGVSCTDCHSPHSLKLHVEGNGLCVRCHDKDGYDAVAHHHHEPGTPGAACVECHMPESTYMVVDPRRDHSIRIPRPDLTISIGSPNACNRCHTEKTPEWAAEACTKWYGKGRLRFPHYGEIIHAGRTGAAGAEEALCRLALDLSAPFIARATALSLLGSRPSRRVLDAIQIAVRDREPLVRATAVDALVAFDPGPRLRLAVPLLDDPVRLVRIRAARVLAPIAARRFAPEQHESIAAGFLEFVESELANSDRPSAHVNLALFFTERRLLADAELAYRTALRLSPSFTRAYVNFADLCRILGRDEDGEELLREALKISPEDGSLYHALGLNLIRRERALDALMALETAARLAPEVPRFSYVHAVALNSIGKAGEALAALENAHRRTPGDRDILTALATMHRDGGDLDRAVEYAKKLVAASPRDWGARTLLSQLEAMRDR